MIERGYNFCCDWCGGASIYLESNVRDAKHDARIDDWIIYHKNHCFCSRECFLDYARSIGLLKEGGKNGKSKV